MGETKNREHAVRLLELENKWLKKYNSLEKVYEAIGLEQFLNTLPVERGSGCTKRSRTPK